MRNFYISIVSVLLVFTGFSQEEDEACLPPAKKVVKYLEVAKTAAPQAAAENYGKAIEEAPDNAMVYFEFGAYAYHQGEDQYANNPNPSFGDRSFQRAEDLLTKAAGLCDSYHTDMYFFLGIINYTQEQKDEAMKWFKKFIEFKSDDLSRFNPEYTKQVSDVKSLMKMEADDAALKEQEVPFNPVMVKNVSSEYDEYFPMISPDNLFMFYTRKMDEGMNSGYMGSGLKEYYTFSERQSDDMDFTKGKPFAAPFNKGDFASYGAATMSVDNKEMIMCACKKTQVFGQDYLDCDLYSTTFEKVGPNPNDYKWSELVNLGPKINTPDGWEGQPSMSADGQILFYTAMRATTQDNDVFMVKRNADGTWGTPEPFTPINTKGKDKSPFLHQDSETLYFVSTTTNERKGAGGLDIFYMRMGEDGEWSEPRNIGYPINTPEDELGLFVSTNGELAYFSSRQGGNWNIYGFELYEEARPKPVTILKGELKDPQGAPIENATVEIAYSESDKVETVKVNGNDGRYAVVVKQEKPQDIIVSVKKEGSAYDAKLITKEDLAKKEDRPNSDLAIKELKVGEAYTINDILYDYNSDVLSEKSKFVLREFARYLKANENIKIAIQGHTDSDGDDARNLDLSDRRAKGVQRYLISLGIDESRLSAKGYGEAMPKVANDTAENKAKNRRTDFLIEGM